MVDHPANSALLASGLTIVRNGVRLDYPFIEAIRSGLPLVDEYVVVVGDSDDDTVARLEALNEPKLRLVHTTWSPLVTPQKCLLAQQTNIGLHQCRGRWCVYLQGNEVLHERSYPRLRELMLKHKDNDQVEALLLERLTFWADYDHYFRIYPERFKYSPRIVKPHGGMYSIRDAMSFAVFDRYSTRGRYPRALDSGEDIYRYGCVRSLVSQTAKLREAVHHKIAGSQLPDDYYYSKHPARYFAPFTDTHPAVMAARQGSFPAQYDLEDARSRHSLSWKERKRLWETAWYLRFGYTRRFNNRYTLLGKYQSKQRQT